MKKVFNFKKSNNFVLNSLNEDLSRMRQYISNKFLKEFGKKKFYPESRYVELYINQKYWGLYLFSELVNKESFGYASFNSSLQNNNLIKKMRLYSDKIEKAFSEIFPAPQIAAQLQKNIK